MCKLGLGHKTVKSEAESLKDSDFRVGRSVLEKFERNFDKVLFPGSTDERKLGYTGSLIDLKGGRK